MNQPELGKRISQLRKEKGYTQEELVDMCDISVRTLQRIESGDVTPRNYTLKSLFNSLDCNESFAVSENRKQLRNKLEQFRIYVFDLFNLKTKTMKKISILTTMFVCLFLAATAINKEKSSNETEEFLDNSKMVFFNFSCENCFEVGDELIGHGVSFKASGVYIKVDLIKLDKKTREFNCGFISGSILENRLELLIPKDLASSEYVELNGDKINKSDNGIELIGNARISTELGDSIEAEHIILTFE